MSVGPTKNSSGPLFVPPNNKGQTHKSSAEARAESAEREANERIANANENAEEFERQARRQIDTVKDEYSKRSALEAARQEEAYEKQRQKGYESLANLQRRQNAELKRVTQQGEKQVDDQREILHGQLISERAKAESEIQQTQLSAQAQIEMARKSGSNQRAIVEYDNQKKYEDLRQAVELNSQRMKAESEAELSKAREIYSGRTSESLEQFEKQHQSTLKTQQQSIQQLNTASSRKLNRLREDTSSRLSAYESRQEDPFYKLMSLEAELTEDQDAFVLTARIPTHEQSRVSVNVSGNRLVVSGQRKNEERLDIGPGRTQTTASYQSFSETFPLSFPVEPRLLTREFDGDILTVRVPKSGKGAEYTPYQRKVDRARLERPQFPENLPVDPAATKRAKEAAADGADDELPSSPPLG